MSDPEFSNFKAQVRKELEAIKTRLNDLEVAHPETQLGGGPIKSNQPSAKRDPGKTLDTGRSGG
jgi:hypothetical protein